MTGGGSAIGVGHFTAGIDSSAAPSGEVGGGYAVVVGGRGFDGDHDGRGGADENDIRVGCWGELVLEISASLAMGCRARSPGTVCSSTPGSVRAVSRGLGWG